eukprot:m.108452 g.108452  ORF g.108452 m.108452 type:complete len:82 (+) comp9190_c0_seq1:1270-1515(+)
MSPLPPPLKFPNNLNSGCKREREKDSYAANDHANNIHIKYMYLVRMIAFSARTLCYLSPPYFGVCADLYHHAAYPFFHLVF